MTNDPNKKKIQFYSLFVDSCYNFFFFSSSKKKLLQFFFFLKELLQIFQEKKNSKRILKIFMFRCSWKVFLMIQFKFVTVNRSRVTDTVKFTFETPKCPYSLRTFLTTQNQHNLKNSSTSHFREPTFFCPNT